MRRTFHEGPDQVVIAVDTKGVERPSAAIFTEVRYADKVAVRTTMGSEDIRRPATAVRVREYLWMLGWLDYGNNANGGTADLSQPVETSTGHSMLSRFRDPTN